MKIKFLDEVTAKLVLDYDPDTLETFLDEDQFQKDEYVDIRDVYWNDGQRTCVEFTDGSVSLLNNNDIEITGKSAETYELTEADILPFVPVDIQTDDGIKTINLDF
jgi:hypothetical protein